MTWIQRTWLPLLFRLNNYVLKTIWTSTLEYENGAFKLLLALKWNQIGEITWINPTMWCDNFKLIMWCLSVLWRWFTLKYDSFFPSYCPQKHVTEGLLCYLIYLFSYIVELEAFKLLLIYLVRKYKSQTISIPAIYTLCQPGVWERK